MKFIFQISSLFIKKKKIVTFSVEKLDFVVIYCAELRAPNESIGRKLNSSIVTNLFIAKSVSFLRQKFLLLKVLLVTLLVTKLISSLNVRNSNEKKLSPKQKLSLKLRLYFL